MKKAMDDDDTRVRHVTRKTSFPRRRRPDQQLLSFFPCDAMSGPGEWIDGTVGEGSPKRPMQAACEIFPGAASQTTVGNRVKDPSHPVVRVGNRSRTPPTQLSLRLDVSSFPPRYALPFFFFFGQFSHRHHFDGPRALFSRRRETRNLSLGPFFRGSSTLPSGDLCNPERTCLSFVDLSVSAEFDCCRLSPHCESCGIRARKGLSITRR
jgi:hypothetical protein